MEPTDSKSSQAEERGKYSDGWWEYSGHLKPVKWHSCVCVCVGARQWEALDARETAVLAGVR